MSTFSGLNTAYTGLVAARAGLDVVGQNIANVNTEGYTRQRVTTSAIGAGRPDRPARRAASGRAGRLASTASPASATCTWMPGCGRPPRSPATPRCAPTPWRSSRAACRNPGANGLSAQLQEFWAAWQDLGQQSGRGRAGRGAARSRPACSPPRSLAATRQSTTQWTQLRSDADGMVTEVNDAAAQVADLNGRIRADVASGGSANELLDQRSTLTTTIAALTGGTVRATGRRHGGRAHRRQRLVSRRQRRSPLTVAGRDRHGRRRATTGARGVGRTARARAVPSTAASSPAPCRCSAPRMPTAPAAPSPRPRRPTTRSPPTWPTRSTPSTSAASPRRHRPATTSSPSTRRAAPQRSA